MTPHQCETARILLGWTQARLARTARVSIYDIDAFERGAYGLMPVDYSSIYAVFYGAGVEFSHGTTRLVDDAYGSSLIAG